MEFDLMGVAAGIVTTLMIVHVIVRFRHLISGHGRLDIAVVSRRLDAGRVTRCYRGQVFIR
jgi:hypothetical protein